MKSSIARSRRSRGRDIHMLLTVYNTVCSFPPDSTLSRIFTAKLLPLPLRAALTVTGWLVPSLRADRGMYPFADSKKRIFGARAISCAGRAIAVDHLVLRRLAESSISERLSNKRCSCHDLFGLEEGGSAVRTDDFRADRAAANHGQRRRWQDLESSRAATIDAAALRGRAATRWSVSAGNSTGRQDESSDSAARGCGRDMRDR